MLETMMNNVQKTCPLIHNITNYVTVNDCANILLAAGASPIMADEPLEAEDITSICSGLNINMGTLNQRTVESMILAGKKANALNHPVLFDPVGAGASKYRLETAKRLLKEVDFDVIRGNVSEIKTLMEISGTSRGVDASAEDKVTKENLDQAAAFAKQASRALNAVIFMTGAIDIIADENTVWCIYNGVPEMAAITGTGCQLSALTTAYISANPDHKLEACAAAAVLMGLAGEKAKERMSELDGNSSMRSYIIDAVNCMTPLMLAKGAKYEIR